MDLTARRFWPPAAGLMVIRKIPRCADSVMSQAGETVLTHHAIGNTVEAEFASEENARVLG
ncbi:MAG TPA: hypothetical protein VGC06_08655 [Actinomycetes bacterium]